MVQWIHIIYTEWWGNGTDYGRALKTLYTQALSSIVRNEYQWCWLHGWQFLLWYVPEFFEKDTEIHKGQWTVLRQYNFWWKYSW